jgi:hypothetical protein
MEWVYYFYTQITNEERAVYIYIYRIRKIVLGNLAIIMAMKIVTIVSLDSGLFFYGLIWGRICGMIWGRICDTM